MRLLWLVFFCALVAGCGSGSQQSAGTDSEETHLQPVTGPARLVVTTRGATADTVLYGTQFTLRLPEGVALAANPDDHLLQAGVLQPAPAGSFAGASYLAPTAGSGAVLQVNILHPTGFTVGPLAALYCTIPPGMTVTTNSFSLYDFSARDANGVPIPGITAHLALQTQ